MTVAELDTKPLLEVRGLKMHFPVTDLTQTMRPRLGETPRRNRLALIPRPPTAALKAGNGSLCRSRSALWGARANQP